MHIRTVLPLLMAFAGWICAGQERALLPVDSAMPSGVDRDGSTLALPAPEADQVSITDKNGVWTLGLRLASPGADGLQLFIEDLRLPAGGRVALYPVLTDGSLGPVAAEYTGAGPLGGDAFWTRAIAGDAAYLEVSLGEEASALPLRVSSLRRLTADGLLKLDIAAPEMEPRAAEVEGTSGVASFRGAALPFTVQNGEAVFEGDMILGELFEIDAVDGKGGTIGRQSVGMTSTSYRWPNGVIPYDIDPTMPNQYRITDAIAHWNAQLAGTINLKPRSGEAYYIRFVNAPNAGTCSAYIGYTRRVAQAVNIGAYCSTGNVIHEIGHAVGLLHEHTREDRNSFVTINYANITSGQSYNFDQAISTTDDLGSYDHGSIMHYGAYSFSANGQPTITTIPAGIPIGQRNGLSAGDIAGVRTMYPTATQPPPPTTSPTTVAVTVASNPSGQQVVVDGTAYTAPYTFSWTSGSAHTISANDTNNGSTRYLFQNWTDGGARTHTVTVPTSAWSVTANYQKQHKLNVSSSNTSLGTVSNSPSAADGFYNEGTTISVAASSVNGACFAGWSGISAPASTPVSLNLSGPASVTGNFSTGAVSVAPSSFPAYPASGGYTNVNVYSGGCPWTAKSNDKWISIVAGTSGTGNGVVSFTVDGRNGRKSRTGSITIGNQTITIVQ